MSANASEVTTRRTHGTSLRSRLVVGLSLAVVLPFVVFWYVGDSELRRSTKVNLGQHMLNELARRSAESIRRSLELAHRQAETLCATAEVRSMFGAGSGSFRDFWARLSEMAGELGDVLFVDRDGVVLFQMQRRRVIEQARGKKLPPGPMQQWLDVDARSMPRLLAPEPNPLTTSSSVSTSLDPEQYVLPLIIPIVDDAEQLKGTSVFLLPVGPIQKKVDNARESLVNEKSLRSGEAFVVDRGSGSYVLHTDRARIGQAANVGVNEGFTELDDGTAVATSHIQARPGLVWSAGVRVDEAELFRVVDDLAGFFLGLVALVLLATVGIATLISVAATRSLGKLEDVTEQLGAGDLSQRADVAGPREVRKLAGALNTMALQLEAERERLKVAERDRAHTDLARQVAHEIKNPLQPVRLHAELILRMFRKDDLAEPDRERARSSAQVILRQVEALRKIVQDFSDYAHAASPIRKLTRFPVSEVVDELVKLYSVGADGVRVEVRDGSADAELIGSPLRLQQVLVNLVKNAIEATDGSEGDARVEVETRIEGDVWVAEVLDRGVGLPEGGARQAFIPSYSTKAGGTGLGLAISQRHVDAMEGAIRLAPRPGGGVAARVEIPLAREE